MNDRDDTRTDLPLTAAAEDAWRRRDAACVADDLTVYLANAQRRGPAETRALRTGLADLSAEMAFAPWLTAPDPDDIAADLVSRGWRRVEQAAGQPPRVFDPPEDGRDLRVAIPRSADGGWPWLALQLAAAVAAYEGTRPAGVLARWLRGRGHAEIADGLRARATLRVLEEAGVDPDTGDSAHRWRRTPLARLAVEVDQAARALDAVAFSLERAAATLPVHADLLSAQLRRAEDGRRLEGDYPAAQRTVNTLVLLLAQYAAARKRLAGLAASWNAALLSRIADEQGDAPSQ